MLKEFGIDGSNIILIGHSAGAHISLLALVRAAMLKQGMDLKDAISGKFDNTNSVLLETVKQFIGLAGPYEISQHYKYETGRGVEWLSPMKPAMQGRRYFQR